MDGMDILKSFVKFVDSQPKHKTINHTSWRSCAVGAFCEEADLQVGETVDLLFDVVVEKCLPISGNNGLVHGSSYNGSPTYGALSEYYHENFKQELED